MRKANKEETTKRILDLGSNSIIECLKLETKEIIFPKCEETDESKVDKITNCVYLHNACSADSKEYLFVMRFVGNQVYMATGEERIDPFVYNQLQSLDRLPKIGCQSSEALLTLMGEMNKLIDSSQKLMVANFFTGVPRDFVMVTSYMQARRCIRVTEQLYHKGLRYCVDEWTPTDENGDGEITELNIGDYVVVAKNYPQSTFCVRQEEFEHTHSFGWCGW